MDSKKPVVFVITPFNDDFLALFDHLKDVFKDDYIFTNAGDLDNQQNILQDIVEGIYSADVIVADLTGLNANVFYELGLAHAIDKKVIIITQDISELPFDIKSYRANEYSLQFNKIPKLVEKLKVLLAGAIDNSIKYGNPMSDFIPNLKQAENSNDEKVSDETSEVEISDDSSDAGFFDYLADIEEYAKIMTGELTSMKDEFAELKTSVDLSNDEINRVKKKSGITDTNFVRNLCRKLATPTNKFANQVKEHNAKISHCWVKIENGFLSLLDSKFIFEKPNRIGIQKSMSELKKLQIGIAESNDKIDYFITSLNNVMGLERRLTQAATMLTNEFDNYIKETETMHSSIDRILAKGELVLNANNSSVE